MIDFGYIIKRTPKNGRLGYTLAEVIIVMLVIAVVVGVSIKIIKAKMDNILSYTYYSGYSILRGVTGQIVADFRATQSIYTDTAYYVVPMNNNLLANKKENFIAKAVFYLQHVGQQPAYAAEPTEEEKQEHYCQGEKWDNESSSWVDETPWPPCGETGEFSWNEEACRCVPETKTVPRSGANFCKKFVEYSNTKTGTSECSGSNITAALTDFSGATPDIVFRNGMKLYNIHNTPGDISDLQNNTAGGSYDGVENVNTYGYTVYLDIDGDKGSSTLWEDVFKFYITMSGKVIPAYAGDIGGSNSRYLMTSVMKEEITADGHRQIKWIKKSVPFKEGACASNYVGINTPYCLGETVSAECPEGIGNVCSLKHISPVKFF